MVRACSWRLTNSGRVLTQGRCILAIPQVARACSLHVTEAILRGWVTAELPNDHSHAIELTAAVPYWMRPPGVSNDITLDGMMVLTGPNTAGEHLIVATLLPTMSSAKG